MWMSGLLRTLQSITVSGVFNISFCPPASIELIAYCIHAFCYSANVSAFPTVIQNFLTSSSGSIASVPESLASAIRLQV